MPAHCAEHAGRPCSLSSVASHGGRGRFPTSAVGAVGGETLPPCSTVEGCPTLRQRPVRQGLCPLTVPSLYIRLLDLSGVYLVTQPSDRDLTVFLFLGR